MVLPLLVMLLLLGIDFGRVYFMNINLRNAAHEATMVGGTDPAVTCAQLKAIVDLLSAEYTRALNKPEVRNRIVEMGYIPVGSSPEEYAAHFRSELDRLNALVKAANIKVEQ